ncbi:4-hydroxy-tetrahydrodipicolinate reductase [Taylorella equigenitalis]|uniref:4-hydroxy-tetrahydrodipicolinate reductase n=2 Tax=Taylorella equigenitalis TaxID=29575 RepID=I7III6_9BURK|nr:4-hydroxy-tetrahydrodipicolinate reductase [Taylorella equigenitalis]AFN36275.1 dihydrodipicolinate reductase [Taylorella equigenitalis ATCC 35865]ASY30846.1 4-hydroxy-tetrahydrodipicolinate reductase [Taylorella equigenitalis]ASY39674.1 4-hydroxy-tetrahydrodipicolinate reductase [Taylorella equigenitalis]ASY41126.1 4-hydroxy-tetrahydrodipicolinate reductase [Taylorella equigenitalis]ASY42611.1 4-hydroxy-tetrahydrodipicolinate reductase [Taylorella equigenitalis]
MKIAITGASGRMGQMLQHVASKIPDFSEVALIDLSSTEHEISSIIEKADCVIDFTRPEGTMKYLDYCHRFGTSLVIGTTGFTADQKKVIEEVSKNISLVMASNMSFGVNVTVKLLQEAAKLLKGYDIEVFEAHHKHKVDSPSGTAIMMGEAIAKVLDVELEDVADWTRHGHVGARKDGHIGFSVVRGGSIVGEHKVMFCGDGEVIEITHKSSNREHYAEGACRAAMFLKDKDTGLFDMQDVIDSGI